MTTSILKPTIPGTRVTFPGTRTVLPDEGAEVEMTSYWYERIRDGSVQVVEDKSAPAEPKQSEETRTRAPSRSPKKD